MFKQVNSLLLIKSYFVFNFLLLLFWLKKILNFWQFAKINTREKFSNEPSAKINTRKMQFFFEKKITAKISTSGNWYREGISQYMTANQIRYREDM